MTGDDREFLGRDRAEGRQHHLAAVCVTREHQRHAERSGFCQSSWVVRQQDGHWCGVAGEIGNVDLAFRPESDADDIDRLAFDPQSRARVLQHLDAVLSQGRRHLVIVVVIAENSKHTMRR